MNREIKFRAWDKRFKKMDFGGGDLLLRINEKDFSEPQQYTGLKDKNGKEIYEGDIIITEWNDKKEVVFWKGCFCNKREDGNGHIFNEKKVEVIGNIYENKDLLK